MRSPRARSRAARTSPTGGALAGIVIPILYISAILYRMRRQSKDVVGFVRKRAGNLDSAAATAVAGFHRALLEREISPRHDDPPSGSCRATRLRDAENRGGAARGSVAATSAHRGRSIDARTSSPAAIGRSATTTSVCRRSTISVAATSCMLAACCVHSRVDTSRRSSAQSCNPSHWHRRTLREVAHGTVGSPA